LMRLDEVEVEAGKNQDPTKPKSMDKPWFHRLCRFCLQSLQRLYCYYGVHTPNGDWMDECNSWLPSKSMAPHCMNTTEKHLRPNGIQHSQRNDGQPQVYHVVCKLHAMVTDIWKGRNEALHRLRSRKRSFTAMWYGCQNR
jgi:hypothetical protein